MKKLAILAAIIILLLSLSACGGTKGTPIPTGNVNHPLSAVEAPDDVFPTPGGWGYRTNIHQELEESAWPPIESHYLILYGHGISIEITYRDYIETKAGETRNNIFGVRQAGDQSNRDLLDDELRLYSLEVPNGITLTQDMGGGNPGLRQAVLMIAISPGAAPGQYTFRVGIELDGKDYGSVPCTIKVIE